MQVSLSIYNFKKILKGIFFILIFIFLFQKLNFMFRPYNIRIKRWEAFYKVPKNKLDIVFLGSSHSYTTYYPEMIDSSLKINSFNMASNSQQIDQLYFNLKEILKYQKPNIIFIELFSLAGNSRDNKGNWFVYDNLDGQKISLNKLDAILNYRKKEDRRNSLFPLIRNHNDWKKIEVIEKTLSEFKKDEKSRKNFRGFERVQSEMGEEVKNKYITEKKSDYSNFKISDFNEDYLKKIKQLSEKYNFKIIYVYSPMYRDFINPNYQNKHKHFLNIVNLYADDLLDFNIIGKNIGMNERWFENGYIGYQHTSFYGARKITEYVIDYLNKNYTLKSRESEKYWQERNRRKNIGYEQKVASNLELMNEIKIKEIVYVPENENKGILEVRFNQNEVIKEIEDYRLKIHALPINKEEKKLLKNGYQNWDMEIKLKKDKDYFYINREIDPQLQEYNLNIALYKIKKDKNNKVIGYPNFGNQLNIEFKNK